MTESNGQQSLKTKLAQLPLRDLGFNHVPAVPVDLAGIPDMLIKLGVRAKQYEQPLQGLSKTFTIGGSTAPAYNSLYGSEAADAKTTEPGRVHARHTAAVIAEIEAVSPYPLQQLRLLFEGTRAGLPEAH